MLEHQAAIRVTLPGHRSQMISSCADALSTQQPIPYRAEARQDLNLRKETGITSSFDADPVKTEPVRVGWIRNALNEEGRLVAGLFKVHDQISGQVG